ncbi:MAG TPA: TRAP transporter small permease subunit [Nocardioidaceae bacterium]|nr:TRAP transporter small permease subunit [Nocardioidaceae bacterium]
MKPTANHAPPGWARRAVDVVTRVELALAGIAVAVIFVLVLIQAGQRYLPVEGWSWTGELAKFSLVWATFTATGVLVTKDAHISLQLVDTIKNPVVTRIIRVFACAVVAVVGVGLATEAWVLIDSQSALKSPAMRMPMSWLYVLPFLGFVSTVVRATVAAVVFAVRGVPEAPHDVTVVAE